MSIITEALKKAERDRALKARRTPQFATESTTALSAAMESERLVTEFLREREKRLNESALFARVRLETPVLPRSASYGLRKVSMILIFFAIVSAIILVLYGLTRWPDPTEGPSVLWHQTLAPAESEASPKAFLTKEATSSEELTESSGTTEPTQEGDVLTESTVAREAAPVISSVEEVSEIPGTQDTMERPAQELSIGPTAFKSAQIPFLLSGISVSGVERYAVINGQIVRVGDWVDGAFVREILDHEAILVTRSGEIKLKLIS